MDKEKIIEELKQSIGSEFEPQIIAIVDKVEVMTVGDLSDKEFNVGEKFWLRGEKIEVTNGLCKKCHFHKFDNCRSFAPTCRGKIIFRKL